MTRLLLLVVGKSKKTSFKELEDDYLSRLSNYIPADMILVRDSSDKNILKRTEEEGKGILKKLEASDLVVVCDEKGQPTSSLNLARDLQKWKERGMKRLVFVVGGAYGLSEEVKRRGEQLLRLSELTLPHELARVVLLEQLYRACTILKGEKYHH